MTQAESRDQIGRRSFMIKSAACLGLLGLGALGFGGRAQASGAKELVLPALPFAENALEPYISARTMSFHYGKHHAGYVKKTSAAIAGTQYEGKPLIDIIQMSKKAGDANVFNNSAQVFNHTFFWNSMKPGGGGEPTGKMLEKINSDFGSYAKFKEAFSTAAGSQFGSGWAWLVIKDGKLEVMQTANADTPVADGMWPLLTLDVWEHAYYLDYQNRRGDFVTAYLDHLVNWDFASQNVNT